MKLNAPVATTEEPLYPGSFLFFSRYLSEILAPPVYPHSD